MAIFNWLDQQNIYIEALLIALAMIIVISIYLTILYFVVKREIEKKMIRLTKRYIPNSAIQQAQSNAPAQSAQPHPMMAKLGSNIKATPESNINVGDNKIKNDIISNKPFDGVEASVHDN